MNKLLNRATPRFARSTASAVAVFAIAAATLTGIQSSSAAWNDTERNYGDIGTLDCDAPTDLTSRATGRMLNGSIGAINLDAIAGIRGVVVNNDGTSATSTSPGAVSQGAGTDAFGAGVSATALFNAVNIGITPLTLPLNSGTGTYNQYGQAHETGISTGAAGAVTNTGAVDTGAVSSGTAGKVGTLRLSDISGLTAALAGLTDVSVEIGAVAAVTSLDGCPAAWAGGAPSPTDLDRSYLVSSLKAQLTSDAVKALTGTGGTVPTAVGGVQTLLNTLIGTPTTNGTAETNIATGAVTSLTGAISSLLTTASTPLVTLGLGGTDQTTAAVTIDLSTVTNYLTSPLSDGTVAIDLASGTVSIDIEALAGGLNNRPANTRVLTAAQLNDVVERVEDLLQARLAQIDTALDTALAAATLEINVNLKLTAHLLAVPPLTPGIGPIDAFEVKLKYLGTLAQYASPGGAGVVVTGPSVTLLGGTGIGDALLNPILASLTAGLLNPVVTTVTPAVLNLVLNQLTTPLTGAISTATSNFTTLVTSTITLLDPVLESLAGVLNLTLNSRPDVAPFPSAPHTPLSGEYFETALRVDVLSGLPGPSLLSLYLANASVGPNQ